MAVTEASTLEMTTDSEVMFRKVLGSSEILPTRPGVDPLEVTRPMADVSWTSRSPQAASPSVITRQPTRTSPGPWPPVASHVFGPLTTQVEPEVARTFHTPDDPGSSHPRDPGTFHIISSDSKFTPSGSHTILTFPHQPVWQHRRGRMGRR